MELKDSKGVIASALSGFLDRLAATESGRKIKNYIHDNFPWVVDPTAKLEFYSAFKSGLEKFEREQGRHAPARSAMRVLNACLEDSSSGLDRASVLEQIFGARVEQKRLERVVATHKIEFEDATVPDDEVARTLVQLIADYLRPAFQANPYFANQIGFTQVTEVLQKIQEGMSPVTDLATLRTQYMRKLVELFDVIPLQGISPKVQNRTVGMRMADIFIHVVFEAQFAGPTYFREYWDVPPIDEIKALVALLKDPALDTGPRAAEPNAQNEQWSRNVGPFESIITSWNIPAVRMSKMRDTLTRRGPTVTWRDAFVQGFADYTLRGREPAELATILRLPRVVIQGDPGSGKSTLLRYIAWSVARGRGGELAEPIEASLPVFARAIEFGEALERGTVKSLHGYILDSAGRFGALLDDALSRAKGLILVDGLDEVSKPQLRARVKESVDDFCADPTYGGNRLVITSRIVGYERAGIIGRFPHYKIQELSDGQIHEFTQRWYRAIHEDMPGGIDVRKESDDLVTAISGNSSIQRMARNPLLLTIIALIKWQGRTLPESRVLLYDAAIQTLIRSWPLTQRGKEFDELFIREWLAPVAHHILRDKTGEVIDENSLMEELVASMLKLKSMSEIDASTASRNLLDDIGEHTGFILPKGTDEDGRVVYGFLHQTFAEYLAAYFISGQWDDEQLDLRTYAYDPYWREVFLLLAGHLGMQRRANAGKLIEALRELAPTKYEGFCSRSLLLACEILCDGVPAGPASTVEKLISDLLKLWHDIPIGVLRSDIVHLFLKLKNTEYASVLARLAFQELDKPSFLALARTLGSQAFEDSLSRLLLDENPEVRIGAAEAKLRLSETGVANAAASVLRTRSPILDARATAILVGLGDQRGTQEAARIVGAGDFGPVWFLFKELEAGERNEVAAAVAPLLQSESRKTRSWAVLGLAALRDLRASAQLVDAVFEGATPEEAEEYQLFLLLVIDRFRRSLLSELLRGSDSNGVRARAAEALIAQVGVDAKSEVVPILPKLRKLDRIHIAKLLADLDEPVGVESLGESLSDPDEEAKFRAAWHLAARHDPRGVPVLRELVDSQEVSVRKRALRTLCEVSTDVPVEQVISLAREQDTRAALTGLDLLSKRSEEHAAAELARILEDGSDLMRAAAAELLVGMDSPIAFNAIREKLDFMMESTQVPSHQESGRVVPSLAESAYRFLTRHLDVRGRVAP